MKKGNKVKLRFKSLRNLCFNSPIIFGFRNSFDKHTIKQLAILFSSYYNKIPLVGVVGSYGAYIGNTREKYLGVTLRNKYGRLDRRMFEKKDLIRVKS